MLNLTTALKQEINKIESEEAYLVLLDIKIDDDLTLYLVRNNEDFIFAGQVYQAFPFELPSIKQSSEGEIPEVQISVCNIDRVVQSYVEQANGAGGALVTLRVVNSKYPQTALVEELFSVDKTSCKEDFVVFTIGLAYKRSRRPLQRYMKNACPFKFKGVECGYSGIETSCNHTLNDCRARFNSKRYGGQALIGGGVYK